jgi:hypothetical protein
MDDTSEHMSVASSCSFQSQLMRCGFLPENSVSSFDLKDLTDLEINCVDGDDDKLNAHHQPDDHGQKNRDSTQSTLSPSGRRRAPPRRGGLRATLSFRLNRPSMLKDGASLAGVELGTTSLRRNRPNGSSVAKTISRTRRVARSYSDGVVKRPPCTGHVN